MGNLLACFGAPKKGDRRRPSPLEPQAGERYRSLRTSPAPDAPPAQRVAPERRSACQSVPHEVGENGFDGGNGRSSSDDDDGGGKKQPKAVTGSPKKKVTFDMNVQTYESAATHPADAEDVEDRDEEAKRPGAPVFPPNHRYQGCASSDDEDDADDDELYGAGEEDGDDCGDLIQLEELEEEGEEEEEESFSSYFSKRPGRDTREHGEGLQLPAFEMARDRSDEVRPVLNPVENLSPWREVKAAGKATPPGHAKKENVWANPHPCAGEREVPVDASLSSWLTPPRRSNTHASDEREGSGSCRSRSNASTGIDDRPILGALTVDDLKRAAAAKCSPSPSPRKSPSRSPEDTPIVGTVGQYWSHRDASPGGSTAKGIPNTTSKYSEDKRVRWRATPFEVRLERALSRGPADVAVA